MLKEQLDPKVKKDFSKKFFFFTFTYALCDFCKTTVLLLEYTLYTFQNNVFLFIFYIILFLFVSVAFFRCLYDLTKFQVTLICYVSK